MTPGARAFIAGMLALAVGCGAEESREADAPSFEGSAPGGAATPGDFVDPANAAGPPGPLTGVWTVVGHAFAGAAAMAEEEARDWHGRTIRLLDWEAQAPGARCAAPEYRTTRPSAEAFIADFRAWPSSLTLPVGPGGVEVLRVQCEGQDWIAPGGRLVRMPEDRALTVWDGVFFVLERDSAAEAVDFRAQGNEPGWILEIDLEEHMRLVYDYGERRAYTPVPEPKASGGATEYHAITEASDLLVRIVPEPCADDMSGFPFPATVTVTLNGRTFRGCGGPAPFPP